MSQLNLNNLLRKILRLSTISVWSVLYPSLILLRHVHVPANRNIFTILILLHTTKTIFNYLQYLREQKNFNLNVYKNLDETVSNSDALRDLVPFAQFKKREKHPCRSVTFGKVAD